MSVPAKAHFLEARSGDRLDMKDFGRLLWVSIKVDVRPADGSGNVKLVSVLEDGGPVDPGPT